MGRERHRRRTNGGGVQREGQAEYSVILRREKGRPAFRCQQDLIDLLDIRGTENISFLMQGGGEMKCNGMCPVAITPWAPENSHILSP